MYATISQYLERRRQRTSAFVASHCATVYRLNADGDTVSAAPLLSPYVLLLCVQDLNFIDVHFESITNGTGASARYPVFLCIIFLYIHVVIKRIRASL